MKSNRRTIRLFAEIAVAALCASLTAILIILWIKSRTSDIGVFRDDLSLSTDGSCVVQRKKQLRIDDGLIWISSDYWEIPLDDFKPDDSKQVWTQWRNGQRSLIIRLGSHIGYFSNPALRWAPSGIGRFSFLSGPTQNRSLDVIRYAHATQITLPIWLPLLLTLIWPSLQFARHRRSFGRTRKRQAAGLCLHCGYDLRGSADRCPECGTPIAAAADSLSGFSS